MAINIRTATKADKDFIINVIINAEKSGSEIISYCAIFGLTEGELIYLLDKILEEEVAGQELYLGAFLIAEVDGQPAAASASWIEKEEGMASGTIKSNLLLYFMDRELMMKAIPNISIVSEVNIDREEGMLQIEGAYTNPNYRGMGLASTLMNEHILRRKEEGREFAKAQILMMGNNTGAEKIYHKIGFVTTKRKTSDNKEILKLLPGNTKILLERNTL